VGSQLEVAEAAYIAGFLDGDGSLMLQVKKRSDVRAGWRVMFTICFYQDSKHDKPLYWMQSKLGIGYISKRNDHMTELRINGYEQAKRVLVQLEPYIRFKEVQVKTMLKAVEIVADADGSSLSSRKKLFDCILIMQQHNYRSAHRRKPEDLAKILGLTL
jgi:hypothetical protein